MVDVQTAYYFVAATGVLVAAIFYLVNLRETNKNRKIAFTTSIMQNLQTKEASLRFINLLSMEWTDFEDFYKKYDSRVNPENFADRYSFFQMLDSIGYQLRIGLVDLETVYTLNWSTVIQTWVKFKPIFDEYKKSDYANDAFANFEYLANQIAKVRLSRNAKWNMPLGYFEVGAFEKSFKK